MVRYFYIDLDDIVWIVINMSGLIKFNLNIREKIVYDKFFGIVGLIICVILLEGDNLWLSFN